jgi:hypothetical protein
VCHAEHREYVVLQEAKRLIEKGWAKETFARNAHGRPCHVFDRRAVAFCMVGAIERAAADLLGYRGRSIVGFYLSARPLALRARAILEADETITMKLERFNDCASKQRVLAAFDRALKREIETPRRRGMFERLLAA